MSDKTFVGLDITGFEDTGKYRPISRVTLWVDDSNCLTAGDDTGLELEADCPHATQEMVNALLAQLKGYQYQSFTADAANIDPAAELGDGVTVNGIYSVLSQVDDDGRGFPDISSPGEVALEEEYPSAGPMTQEFNRQIAETRSKITKTSKEIQLLVENEIEGLSASITVQLDGITQRINGLDGEFTEVSTTLDGLTVTDSSGTTKIKGSSIETDSLYVNAAHITGTLEADQIDASNLEVNAANVKGTLQANQINLSGSITWSDLASDTRGEINSANNTASSAYNLASSASSTASSAYTMANNASSTVNSWRYGSTTYIDGTQLMTGTVSASTLRGGTIGILNRYGSQIGYMTVGSSTATGLQLVSGGNLYLSSSGCAILMSGSNASISGCSNFYPSGTAANLGSSSLGMWNAVYSYTAEIQTSDENYKHDIAEMPQKYIDMMDDIVPVIYRMNNGTSNRFHTGFRAQNVKAAMDAHEVSDTELAAWCKDVDEEGNEIQMLRYSEFIAILWAKIKQLDGKIKQLEGNIDGTG